MLIIFDCFFGKSFIRPFKISIKFSSSIYRKKNYSKKIIIIISHHGNNFCHSSIMTIEITKEGLIYSTVKKKCSQMAIVKRSCSWVYLQYFIFFFNKMIIFTSTKGSSTSFVKPVKVLNRFLESVSLLNRSSKPVRLLNWLTVIRLKFKQV